MNPNNIMNNHLHTYFDRTQVGRRDFFRQLIFLTFVPLSILLFSLHLLGSYGLNVQPALLCSVCYVIGSVVSLVLYLLKGPKKLRYIMPVSVIFSMLVQGGAAIDIGFYGTPRPYAYYAQSYHLLSNCAYK